MVAGDDKGPTVLHGPRREFQKRLVENTAPAVFSCRKKRRSFIIGLHYRGEEEEEEEDVFVFNDTIEGPRAPAVKPGRITQA
jgi:hypothetical protein